MPILDIEIVTDGNAWPQSLAHRIADAAGKAFDAAPGRVWVKLRTLDAARYAENQVASAPQPVFVSVLLAQHPSPEAWVKTAAALTDAIARCCGRPAENIHLLLLPEARGRMSFGGRIVSPD